MTHSHPRLGVPGASRRRGAAGAPRRPAWVAFALALALLAAPVHAALPPLGDDLVSLDFDNVELKVVIDTIARMTGRNFIYDDRVRGRVTIISPQPIPATQAYAVFESVLQVKGFTTVETPGGALKVIPTRDAKASSIETVRSNRPPPNRDRFVTRLIPLRYIDAASIVTTLKPLVSKEAAMAAYAPTNTVILTESASNIRRLISILESIDVESYKEDLAVIRIEFADATTVAQQVSEIFGAEVASSASTRRPRPSTSSSRRGATPARATAASSTPASMAKARIITDERTNSLIVLAPRTQLIEVRSLVRKLDVPVAGGGRIHVYYLQHADAEELAQTLGSLISGAPAPATGGSGATGGQAQALRSAVLELAGGVTVTADPATNSLVITASKEGYSALSAVIAKLDIERPQVLVEALIMEVDVTDNEELGFSGLVRIMNGDNAFLIRTATDAISSGLIGVPASTFTSPLASLLGSFDTDVDRTSTLSVSGVIRALGSLAGTNIIAAPHILTSDNEEAEIRIGDNIPIISSRVQSAAGLATGLSTSVNVERQDIGVTLRVTPQITEGDSLRLDIYQELTAINEALQTDVGDVNAVGVPLSNRRIENTVVVSNGETIVIGGLISDDFQDVVSKVPFLGDIPFLGWAFKSTARRLTKKNLLIFLTPHIVRSEADLERVSIRKRQEFIDKTENILELSEREEAYEHKRMKEAADKGEPYEPSHGMNPVRHALLEHESRYPIERMHEIERLEAEERERRAAARRVPTTRYIVHAALYGDEAEAMDVLTALVDAGYDGTLSSGERGGVVHHDIRLGPFDSLEDAQWVEEVLVRGHGIVPSIVIQPPDAP